MAKVGKRRLTFKKTRTALFTISHAGYVVGRYIKSNKRLTSKRQFDQISKLSKILSLDYVSLKKFLLYSLQIQTSNTKNNPLYIKIDNTIRQVIVLALYFKVQINNA